MNALCLSQFEVAFGLKRDNTYTFNNDTNQYVAIDLEVSEEVEEFNNSLKIWCKAWNLQQSEIDKIQDRFSKSQKDCSELNKRIAQANDTYKLILQDWAFVCHGKFGDLVSYMMNGLNPIVRNYFIVGDYVFLKDLHYTDMYIVSAILQDGRIELKTAQYGYPIPERCWGMYYGEAEGLRHATAHERFNKMRDD